MNPALCFHPLELPSLSRVAVMFCCDVLPWRVRVSEGGVRKREEESRLRKKPGEGKKSKRRGDGKVEEEKSLGDGKDVWV